MSASLVGSEMCIRDSSRGTCARTMRTWGTTPTRTSATSEAMPSSSSTTCLLYTSDAADDM
eukprot:11135-Alexandrium_andersonii.AAC.1